MEYFSFCFAATQRQLNWLTLICITVAMLNALSLARNAMSPSNN